MTIAYRFPFCLVVFVLLSPDGSMFCLVIFMGNYSLPFHFSYIIMHLKILFLIYYLVLTYTFDSLTGSWSVWPHVVTQQWFIKKYIFFQYI